MYTKANISPEQEYEIFKRDEFTCQRCKKRVPSVVLFVGNKNSAKKKTCQGKDNLASYCYECAGESSSDMMEERRRQLDLLLRWRANKEWLAEDIKKVIVAYTNAKTAPTTIKKKGKHTIAQALKDNNIIDVLDAIDDAFIKSIKYDDDDNITEESLQLFFNNILRFLNYKKKTPIQQAIGYIREICRNRYPEYDDSFCSGILNKYVLVLKNSHSDEEIFDILDKEIKPLSTSYTRFESFSNDIYTRTNALAPEPDFAPDDFFTSPDDEFLPQADQRRTFEDFEIQMDADFDIYTLQDRMKVIRLLHASIPDSTSYEWDDLELKIYQGIHMFISNQRALYATHENIPVVNKTEYLEQERNAMDIWKYFHVPEGFSPCDQTEYPESMSISSCRYIREELMPKIIDDILNIFFYPDTNYDYASAMTAMKLVRENLEAIIDNIVI